MAYLALYNGKSSLQDDVLFNVDGAEYAASMVISRANSKNKPGSDPSAEYGVFLNLYNFPVARTHKPSILAAPGFITVAQQGGNPNYNGQVCFKHSHAGDLTRHVQLTVELSDISTTTAEFKNISSILTDFRSTKYSIFLTTTIYENKLPAVGNDSMTNEIANIVITVEISPVRPSGQLIKIGDTISNHAVLVDYPGEAIGKKYEISVGSNVYMDYDQTFQTLYRQLLKPEKISMYKELVGQEEEKSSVTEYSATMAGLPSIYGAANVIESLAPAIVDAASSANKDLSTGTTALLSQYGVLNKYTNSYTFRENKKYFDGFQTPKKLHKDVRFSMPILIHSTVDPNNTLSNMSFGSFIRAYNTTLCRKAELIRVVPGDAYLRYKSTVILQQIRSNPGFTADTGSVVGAVADNIKHVRNIIQTPISENEIIIPTIITNSAIVGGDIANIYLISGQIYLPNYIRSIIENQTSVAIYNLPDYHSQPLTLTNNEFTINNTDNKWVSNGVYIMPKSNWNSDTNNPYMHKSWYLNGFVNCCKVPNQITMDIPQAQVSHISSVFESKGVTNAYYNTVSYTQESVDDVYSLFNKEGFDKDYVLNRYSYQAPSRKQLVSSWNTVIDQMPIINKIGLKIQSFDIYAIDYPSAVARSSFFYSAHGISPTDKSFYLLPLSLDPQYIKKTTGGINFSKYRDLNILGVLNKETVDLILSQPNKSARVDILNHAFNIVVTSNRSQYRRFGS